MDLLRKCILRNAYLIHFTMKKINLKRIFKISIILLVVLFFGLFTWANWNGPTPAEKLKPKNFALFDLSNIKDNSTFTVLNTQLQKTSGVLATCLKPADKIVSVVFYPDIISRDDIQQKLSTWTNVDIVTKAIVATGPTCPVAGMMGGLSAMKRFLCIRN
jgi:hypothetical protein